MKKKMLWFGVGFLFVLGFLMIVYSQVTITGAVVGTTRPSENWVVAGLVFMLSGLGLARLSHARQLL